MDIDTVVRLYTTLAFGPGHRLKSLNRYMNVYTYILNVILITSTVLYLNAIYKLQYYLTSWILLGLLMQIHLTSISAITFKYCN